MNIINSICITVLFLCISSACQAQNMLDQKPFVGMHHLKLPPAATPPVTKPVDEETPQNNDAPQTDTKPVYKPLDPKEALFKQDDLEEWKHLSEAALAHSDSDIKKLVYLIEQDRGAVPPQGLFLAAQALANRNLMEQAAVYYFVGELRLSFDSARWPATPNKEDVKRLQQDSKKTEDQALPNQNKQPRIDDPNQGIKNLGDQIGAPIIAWMVKDPKRMETVFKKVQEWDASSPYLYLPSDNLGEPVPFDKWEKLLTKTRENYFAQMSDWSKLMAKVRP